MSDSDVIHQYKGSEKAKISTLDDREDIISNEPKDIVKSKQVCVCVCMCVCGGVCKCFHKSIQS